MIKQISYITTNATDPYENLALEEYLFHHVGDTECILYLWQNEKTIVIGRNQNPWKECRVKELEDDGGKLVRRLSGGGAVFHDLGNMNFTFLTAKDNYDVGKQLEVIVQAVKQLGIPAEKSGRNDITVEGRKFSGNAFYSDGLHCYHHGTILINVDMGKLSLYLNVSRDKLVSKGVESVRSRVANLTEYREDLTIQRVEEELIRAFGKVYGFPPVKKEQSAIRRDEIKGFSDKFSSWEWIFGKKMEFSDSITRRFAWGDIDLKFVVDSGIIKQCVAYSDALEIGIFERVAEKLTGCPFTAEAMAAVLNKIPVCPDTGVIVQDIISLIRE